MFFPAGGTATQPFALPASTAFVGLHVLAQSAALVPGINALGAISSNGVDLGLDAL